MPSLSTILGHGGNSIGAINETDKYGFEVGTVRLHTYDRPIIGYAKIEYRLSYVNALFALD